MNKQEIEAKLEQAQKDRMGINDYILWLKEKLVEAGKPIITIGEQYPIVMITECGDRLILNLPEKYLSESYKKCVFSIWPDGQEGFRFFKNSPFDGWFYEPYEKQVFPV